MNNNTIIQAYEVNKRAFHSEPVNSGKQLHHILGRGNDRSKVLLACWLNFQALSVEDHQNYKITKYLKEKNRTIKDLILANYRQDKGGCLAKLCDYCVECPIYLQRGIDN